MRVIDLENIKGSMNNETQFVLRCEEVFHDKISAAAATILSGNRPIVALTSTLPGCWWGESPAAARPRPPCV